MLALLPRLMTSPRTHPALDGLVVLMIFPLITKDDLYFVPCPEQPINESACPVNE